MASEQMSLYDIPPVQKDPGVKLRKSWEDGFQRWSNEKAQLPYDQPLGCCGCGSMCDYCKDNSYGRPCVRALNAMCRDRRITIDYSRRNYEDIWNGRFGDGKAD